MPFLGQCEQKWRKTSTKAILADEPYRVQYSTRHSCGRLARRDELDSTGGEKRCRFRAGTGAEIFVAYGSGSDRSFDGNLCVKVGTRRCCVLAREDAAAACFFCEMLPASKSCAGNFL
jgi:hypothetical protein